MENVNGVTVSLEENQRQAMLLSIAHLAEHLPERSCPLLLECVDQLGGRDAFEFYKRLVHRQYEDLAEIDLLAMTDMSGHVPHSREDRALLNAGR